MTTRIGLFSDPHADPGPVAEALAIFEREGVSQVLCAGDIAGYGERLDETVALLQAHGVVAIRGNHEEWALGRDPFPGSKESRAYLEALPASFSLQIEDVSLYMAHAEPPDRMTKGLRLYDREGEVVPEVVAEWRQRLDGFGHQVLVLGHTHQAFAVRLADTLVINPGSSSFNHSCAILTLPQQQVEWFALGGREIERVWNWGSNEAIRD